MTTTRKRKDEKSTEFGLWLRCQDEIDSKKAGLDGENLDYVWHAYIDGKVMLIEEKRYCGRLRDAQKDTHSIVHQALKFACSRIAFERVFPERTRKIRYYGYHLIQFEKTGPQDGKTWVDGREVSEAELIRFLRFEERSRFYETTVL